MKPPSLTIVIAVFNARETLQQCIDSVVSQTSRDYELIVVDGASTDGSLDILSRNRSQFAYLISEPDKGVYDAWNKALALARGKWVCFLGSDDYLWNDDVVERLLAALRMVPEHIDVAYGRVMLLDGKGEPMFALGESWAQMAQLFQKKMCLPHPAVMHRRTVFDDHGRFDTSFKIAGDYDFLLRALAKKQPHFLGDLVVTAMRPGGLSASPANTLLGLKEVHRAQQNNGLPILWLPRLMAQARVYVRLVLMRLVGEKTTRRLLDLGRRWMGQPAYWTRL